MTLNVGTEVSRKGFVWRILKRSGPTALVSQADQHGQTVAFNVMTIASHERFRLAGKTIEAGESLPSWEQWGSKAWNYGRDIKRAEEAFLSRSN